MVVCGGARPRLAPTVVAAGRAYRGRVGSGHRAVSVGPALRFPSWQAGSRTWTDGWATGAWSSSGPSAASFDDYGVDGEDLGWVTGSFTPTRQACNPHGIVQAGVHGLLLDAAMNFAINAALPGRARTGARSR